MPWTGSVVDQTLVRCRDCHLFVCSWCVRTDINSCRERCDVERPTVPPKECRVRDAILFLNGEDSRKAMLLRTPIDHSHKKTMVRLLAAGKRAENK